LTTAFPTSVRRIRNEKTQATANLKENVASFVHIEVLVPTDVEVDVLVLDQLQAHEEVLDVEGVHAIPLVRALDEDALGGVLELLLLLRADVDG